MDGVGDKHERTLAFAEIALGQIKALRQPAEPRDFEVWYNYATGHNPSLNKIINEALARTGNLTPVEVDAIHQAYFAPSRTSDRVDSLGTKVRDEIEQVMGMISSALGATSNYSERLADASKQLGGAVDRDGLRAIVESLVQTTRQVEHANQALEARLKASKQEILQLQNDLEAVRHENLTDQLTTLANRKYFNQAIANAVSTAAARSRPLSLLMIDIDHFKSFNDSYGHLTGDQVLRLVALCVKQNVKGQDIAARYGGEEFAVVLPDTTLPAAMIVAEHIRRAVMGKELMKRSTGESLGRVTVTIGVATWHRGDGVQTLIERADSCLYAAKRAGRNLAMGETEPMVEARVA